ncbi:MAG TPA: FAD-dependent oxidoreductase [Polyangiaceae bacterium]
MDSRKTYFSRRTALKTIIVGAVAGPAFGCKHQERAPRVEKSAPSGCPHAQVGGEDFTQGHSKRDGFAFPKTEAQESCEIAIIGGGPSGLCAAHFLQDREIVLLEKETHLGGNCTSDSWHDVAFSTGAAFYSEGDHELVDLMREVGAPGMPIEGGDSLIVRGEPFFDFFGDGAARLPFPERVRDDFKRSADAMAVFHERHTARDLDGRLFSDLLSSYAPELMQFWDRFGSSNWGAEARHTSARLGVQAYGWLRGDEKRLSYPGGLGVGARALASALTGKLPGRLRSGTFVHHVENEPGKRGVLVHSLRDGEPHTLRANAVIMALPKFFASRIVQDLGDEQRAAMKEYRYAPYPVFNVCLTGRGPEPAYDNWFLDAPFADFIPADWVLYAGRGPADRKTALTVYHPLPETRRAELLDDAQLVQMADEVVAHLDRHFPGIKQRVEQVQVFRRGHALALPTPGQLARAELASRSEGRIVFAHSDSRGDVSSFPGALRAAKVAANAARALLT